MILEGIDKDSMMSLRIWCAPYRFYKVQWSLDGLKTIRRGTNRFGVSFKHLRKFNAPLRDRQGFDNFLKDLVHLRFDDSLRD